MTRPKGSKNKLQEHASKTSNAKEDIFTELNIHVDSALGRILSSNRTDGMVFIGSHDKDGKLFIHEKDENIKNEK